VSGHNDLHVRSSRVLPSEGVTALFDRGVINSALVSLGTVAEHTRALWLVW
jgi:hypothetical protein